LIFEQKVIFSENGSVRKRISILRPKPLDHVLSEQTPGRERDDGALRVVCNRAAVLEGEKQNRLAQGRTRHVGTQLCQRVAAALEQRRLPPEAKLYCNQRVFFRKSGFFEYRVVPGHRNHLNDPASEFLSTH